MTEPDVALTDYVLTILCSWFAWSLWKERTGKPPLSFLWFIFFISIAIGAFTGGTVHGFFLDETTLGFKLLWPITLLSVGITVTSAWILAGSLLSEAKQIKWWVLFAILDLLLYTLVVVFYTQNFLVVITNYVPAILTLCFAAIRRYLAIGNFDYLWIAFGISVGLIASMLQQTGFALHTDYFNHNATYHVFQGFGLWLMFKGSQGLSVPESMKIYNLTT